MNLDLLISKYLDGELTLEEDNVLRQMLKDDPSAKDEFDSAVLLNAAFRSDADSVVVPADLASETEDLILMKIMQSYKEPVVIKTERRFRYRPVVAFMLAVLMIGGVFSIYDVSDFSLPSNSTESLLSDATAQNETEVSSNSTMTETITSSTDSKASNRTNQRTVRLDASRLNANRVSQTVVAEDETIYSIAQQEIVASPSLGTSSSVLSQSESMLSENPTFESAESSAKIEITSTDADFGKNRIESALQKAHSLPTNVYTQNIQTYGSKFDNSITLNSFEYNENVYLSTFVSNDFARPSRNYKNSKPITSYSQSVGYDIGGNSKLGLEFGYTEYQFDYKSYILLNTGGSSTNAKTEGLNPIGNDPNAIYIPIVLNRQANSYWAGAFWDYSIFETNRISMSGRVGGGFSNDGYVAYSRLFAKARIYGGIYLTLGAEAKGFDALITNQRSAFIGTGSLIYGLQFKL